MRTRIALLVYTSFYLSILLIVYNTFTFNRVNLILTECGFLKGTLIGTQIYF